MIEIFVAACNIGVAVLLIRGMHNGQVPPTTLAKFMVGLNVLCAAALFLSFLAVA